jgi:hypothetical protein
MQLRIGSAKLDKSASAFRRALQYAFYDWMREMPKSKRLITRAGQALQAYALYLLLMWGPFRLPKWLYPYYLVLPQASISYVLMLLFYYAGGCVMNGMLTSEFVRKTQLESDQIAARHIQQSLLPEKLDPISGYTAETFYQPFRDVGGDYFDVIDLPDGRTLFAVADVSGKGMPAALLAANIQALVRSIANVTQDPIALAAQINRHLGRYTPSDRFATAVFVVLKRESGELTYVNAGHNAPIVFGSGPPTFLRATGMPLGLLGDAEYAVGKASIPPGGVLLLFTDGLTDAIPGDDPETRLCDALDGNPSKTMLELRALIDPKFAEDDVTLLLVRRGGPIALNAIALATA